jgi:MGT family glycosyltransferase
VVFTFPHIQPRSHLRDKEKFKFVGCSYDENIHFNGLNDSIEMDKKLKELLDEYPSNRVDNINQKLNRPALIYVSLGTIFNTDLKIFATIVKALDLVNTHTPIKAIISTGSACFDILKEQHQKEENATSNIKLILKTVPQIEILKRASLFITHSGMNSTSEAINFGVPMICLPMALGVDQPLVAYRVADELGLGIRLKANDLDCTVLKDSILKILNDETYAERCLLYRDISQKYDGHQNTVKIIQDILRD